MDQDEKRLRRALWILGIIVFTIFGFIYSAELRAERIDFVQRSLDKIIVVEKDQTYTLPAPRGSGTHVVTTRRNHREPVRDYGPGYRNDKCAQTGEYEKCRNANNRLRR